MFRENEHWAWKGYSSQFPACSSASWVSLGWVISLCLRTAPLLSGLGSVIYVASGRTGWAIAGAFLGCASPMSTGPRLSHAQRQLTAKPVCIAMTHCCWHCPRDFQTLMRNAAGRREGFVLTSEIAPPFALLVTGVIKIHCFPCCPSNGRTAATCTLARGKKSPALGPITECTQKSIRYPGQSPVVARCTTCS